MISTTLVDTGINKYATVVVKNENVEFKAEASIVKDKTKAETRVGHSTVKDKSATCRKILNHVSEVEKKDFRIQLIVAAPESGSDWCRITMDLLTGKTYFSLFYSYMIHTSV